jgi:hypothetical protein
MYVLKYENLDLYIKHTNAGYCLTEYLDEACLFHNKTADGLLSFIDEKLIKAEPFYEKGKLIPVFYTK